MIGFGEGSDWNYETDGDPWCICEGDHYHSVEWLMARDDYYQQLNAMEQQKSPDTGEAPVVGICGTIALMLVAIIVICKQRQI